MNNHTTHGLCTHGSMVTHGVVRMPGYDEYTVDAVDSRTIACNHATDTPSIACNYATDTLETEG
jgi:hypothetical protein